MPFKLIIAGSRSVDPSDEQISAEVAKLPLWGDSGPPEAPAMLDAWIRERVSHVVCGESPGGGADASGKRWALARGIEVLSEPITEEDWRRWGKYLAPKMRNRRVAEVGDIALVFWDGKSNELTDLVTRMVLRRKYVEVVPTRRRPARATRRGAGRPRDEAPPPPASACPPP